MSDQRIEAGVALLQTPQAGFTRPNNTTAYAIGSLVANSVTPGSVVPLAFNLGGCNGIGMVRRARIAKSGTTAANAQFRLHLYSLNPSSIGNGDGGAWSTNTAGYIGSLSLSAQMGRVFTDGCEDIALPDSGSELIFNNSGPNPALYGLLEARAAYAPAAQEIFSVTLEIVQL